MRLSILSLSALAILARSACARPMSRTHHASTCSPLQDAHHLLTPLAKSDACSEGAGLSRVSNPVYSMCVRRDGDMVDDVVRASGGRWPDCDLVGVMLSGFRGLVQPLQTSTGVVLDVGANIGACSMALVAQGHTVVGFEPKPRHVAMIKASVASNQHLRGSLYLHGCGLSDHATDSAQLASELGNTGNSWTLVNGPPNALNGLATTSVDASTAQANGAGAIGGVFRHGVQVDSNIALRRLDDFCDAHFDAVKIDVQGFEASVLRGARRALSRGAFKRIIMEYWPFGLEAHGASPIGMLQLLTDHGYVLTAENGTRIVPATFHAFDAEMREAGNEPPGRGFGTLFAFHESVVVVREDRGKM